MAGRGIMTEVEPIRNDRLRVLRNGRWCAMFCPVNPDRPFSGISLAESFIDEYSKEHDVNVGIIPCADGGTCLDQWNVGGLLYQNAVNHVKLAQRTSVVVGVLWHQGESDCQENLILEYESKFLDIMNGLRKECNLENVPFLLGGLGDFLSECEVSPYLKNYSKVNDILEKIARENDMTGFVSAKGLTSNADKLHFNSKSLREFGIRYYNEFKSFESRITYNYDNLEDYIKTELEKY